jgi:hypothetical protein
MKQNLGISLTFLHGMALGEDNKLVKKLVDFIDKKNIFVNYPLLEFFKLC